MSLLPDLIVALDSNFKAVPGRHFKRLDPNSHDARKLSEANWDEIICANTEALADALRVAKIIAPDSTLRVLGRQIDSVDVLFAEVPDLEEDDDTDGISGAEPRRLVLLEDKLVRNPEAKRQVLAQVLDYAERTRHEWTTDSLCRKVRSPIAAWLRVHAARINVMLAQGEILLVIAGDDIDEDLLRLARRFSAGGDPLSLLELCLVSMAVYRRDGEQLLIPHVVSAVERHQRQLSIKVTVTSEDGTVLPAQIERDDDADATAARRVSLPTNPDVERFLERAKAILSPKLLGEHPSYTATSGNRKVVAYWIDDEARIKIHFGGLTRDTWSPIEVGLVAQSETKRDEWLTRVEQVSSLGQLPVGTVIRTKGRKTVEALKSFPWSAPSDLNDTLLGAVVETVLRFSELFGSRTER